MLASRVQSIALVVESSLVPNGVEHKSTRSNVLRSIDLPVVEYIST